MEFISEALSLKQEYLYVVVIIPYLQIANLNSKLTKNKYRL